MFDTFAQIPLDERWRGQSNPVPIVIAILRDRKLERDDHEGKFLLIRRNRAPYQNAWALVGGKWDFGESLPEAIVREVHEETGLLTRYVSLQGILSERLVPLNSNSEKAAHFLLLVCLMEVLSGDAQAQNEGEVRWFTRSQIDTLNRHGNIIASDYVILSQFSQANPLPFYEVEMATGQVSEEGQEQSQLLRFESIDNHASTTS